MTNKAILREINGATAIEYGLIAGLIAMAVIGGITFLGESVLAMWSDISQAVISAMP